MSSQEAVPSQSPADGSAPNSKNAGAMQPSRWRVRTLMTSTTSQERGKEVREGGKTRSQNRESRRKHHRWGEESKSRKGEEAGRCGIREHHTTRGEER